MTHYDLSPLNGLRPAPLSPARDWRIVGAAVAGFLVVALLIAALAGRGPDRPAAAPDHTGTAGGPVASV